MSEDRSGFCKGCYGCVEPCEDADPLFKLMLNRCKFKLVQYINPGLAGGDGMNWDEVFPNRIKEK